MHEDVGTDLQAAIYHLNLRCDAQEEESRRLEGDLQNLEVQIQLAETAAGVQRQEESKPSTRLQPIPQMKPMPEIPPTTADDRSAAEPMHFD